MDIVQMRWRQVELSKHHTIRWLMLDSSPQGGWDFFLCRAMELVTDRELLQTPSKEALMRRVNLDLTRAYRKRTLPATILGQGATGKANKLWNFVHVARVDSGAAEQCHRE